MFSETGSRDAVTAAISVAITKDRTTEKTMQSKLKNEGILTAAVDFGGEFIASVTKMIERAVVAAKRENLILDSHAEEGAVAGAAREAVSQIMNKAIGLNIGGKIAIARCGEHISVAVFFGIGLLHLNEMAIGLGHRVIYRSTAETEAARDES
ncbi:MAG: HutP family protein [Clostridia bacterium]